MDKLELDLDDLEVDSFQANPEQEGEQGTVQGNVPDSKAPGCSDLCPTSPYGCYDDTFDCYVSRDCNTLYDCEQSVDICVLTEGPDC